MKNSIYSRIEAMRLLGIQKDKFAGLRKTGQLQTFMVGNRVKVRQSAIDDFCEVREKIERLKYRNL